MPNMISLRKFVLSSSHGHMIKFNSNTPTWVPEEAMPEAMAAGCVPVDAAERPFLDDLATAKVNFTGELRKSVMTLAMRDLVKDNKSSNFDTAGLPKLDALKKVLGFEVYKDERTEVYRALMGRKQEGEFPLIHKDAEEVYAIINAETKDDLLQYAREDDTSVKSLTTKDLRKHLLLQRSGLAPS